MAAYYSKSTNGVYPTSVYKTRPVDALLIPSPIYKMYQDGIYCGFDVVDGVVVGVLPEPSDP